MSDKRQKLSNLLKNCRCPSGHRTMFYESNYHRWEATCFCRRTYCIYIDISFLNTKNINILNNIFRLCSWGLTCSEHVLLGKKQSRASVFLSLSESVSIFLILTTCFFWETMASFDINYMYSSLHVKFRVKSAGHRTVSGWFLTTPAGRHTTSYGARPGIGRWFHIQTTDGARTICDHARENS